jgi:hypothetical protein
MIPHAPAVALTLGLSLLLTGGSLWRSEPIDNGNWMQREMLFRALVCALPPGEKIVFVRPRPAATPHHILVDNDPRWRASATWIVREWTPDRHRALMEAAPERAAYIYDESAGVMALMNRDGTASAQSVLSVRDAVSASAGRGLWCR